MKTPSWTLLLVLLLRAHNARCFEELESQRQCSKRTSDCWVCFLFPFLVNVNHRSRFILFVFELYLFSESEFSILDRKVGLTECSASVFFASHPQGRLLCPWPGTVVWWWWRSSFSPAPHSSDLMLGGTSISAAYNSSLFSMVQHHCFC